MDRINKYILEKAKEAGICEEWAGLIPSVGGVDGLLAMYVKGIDFCLEKNFPSNEDLVRLGGDRLAGHGVYIDKAVDLPSGDFIVLLGECTGNIHISGYSSTQLFIKHTSSATINAYGNAFVMIDCFDNTTLDVVASGNSKVVINVYGAAKVTHAVTDKAIIKIVHKNKASY